MSMEMEKCRSCQGLGELPGRSGPESCHDCLGAGTLPSAMVLMERRLRELEARYPDGDGETARDVRWLIGEVRRSHHALVQVLAAGQEVEPSDVGRKVVFLANDVLGVYRASTDA